MKFGVTSSAALISISIMTLESLTSPILSVKNCMLPTSALLLSACVSLAITSKVATVPFCRLMFDSLYSFILLLINVATASSTLDSNCFSLISFCRPSKPYTFSCHLAAEKALTVDPSKFSSTISLA